MSLNINMLGLELSNELIVCLGIFFIVSGLLFFYFKRNLIVLEKAQIEQAKLLQSVILSLQNLPSSNNEETLKSNNLIDISDDENSDDESEDDQLQDNNEANTELLSDDDDDSQEISDNELEEITSELVDPLNTSTILRDSASEIKVIEMNGLEDEEIGTLDEIDESIIDESVEDSEMESSISESINNIEKEVISYKSFKVADLRKMVGEKNLHKSPSKLKKDELIEILSK
jgi:hypothetical protein